MVRLEREVNGKRSRASLMADSKVEPFGVRYLVCVCVCVSLEVFPACTDDVQCC